MELENCCCFTGHRPEKLPDGGDRTKPGARALYAALTQAVEELYGRGIRDFYCGGARGFDTWAAQAVLALREREDRVRLRMILPYWGQEAGWAKTAQEEYTAVLRRADEIRFLGSGYSRGCMYARDKAMVDRAAHVIAYCAFEPSGTAYTLDYARRKGRHIILLNGAEDQTVMTL